MSDKTINPENNQEEPESVESPSKSGQKQSSAPLRGHRDYLPAAVICILVVIVLFVLFPLGKKTDPQTRDVANLSIQSGGPDKELQPLLQRIKALESMAEEKKSPEEKDTPAPHSDTTARLDELEKRIDAWEEHLQKIASVYGAWDDLRERMETSRSFEQSLEHFANLVEVWPQFHSPLRELAEYASQEIPTLIKIRSDLEELAITMKTTKTSPAAQTGWWKKMLDYLSNLIRIHKVDEQEKILVKNMTNAITSAHAALQVEDIRAAIMVLSRIQGDLPPHLQTILYHLKARSEINRLLAFFNEQLLSPRFMQLLIRTR